MPESVVEKISSEKPESSEIPVVFVEDRIAEIEITVLAPSYVNNRTMTHAHPSHNKRAVVFSTAKKVEVVEEEEVVVEALEEEEVAESEILEAEEVVGEVEEVVESSKEEEVAEVKFWKRKKWWRKWKK